MQNIDLEAIEAFVSECRKLAVEMARSYSKQGFARSQKLDSTWVTNADLEIEKVLRAKIAERFPEHHILGEEEGGTFPQQGVVWILDPIDGTFSFVNGIPFYSSLIAVCVNGEPVIGSAARPMINWTLTARKGNGAFLNGERVVNPQILQKSGCQSEILAVADPYRFRMCGFGSIVNQLLNEPFKTRVYPDALGYMLLVSGAVSGFVDPKTEIWDVAPFHVILPECGFSICKWDGSVELSRGSVFSFPGQEPPGNVFQILQCKGSSGLESIS